MDEQGKLPLENQEPKPDKPEPAVAEHSTADYEKFSKPEKPIRNWTRVFSIIAIILVLIAIGAGTYWYFNNHKSAPAKTAQTTQPPAAAKVVGTTKSYTSPNFYLTFDYPSNWTVSDTGGGVMTVTSPETQLQNTAGQSVNGKIVMTIRKNGQKLPEFSAGNATAAIASQKIAYTKPTQTQRANTYLSFLKYADTTAVGGWDGVYITGDNGYTVGQAIPAADFASVDPIIDVTFFNASGKAMTIATSSWNDAAFSDPLLKMLESFAIT